MNASARILVVLATLPLIPILLAAGAIVGAAFAARMTYIWLEFVWEEL